MSAPIKHNDNNNADDPSFYAPPGARRAQRETPRETPFAILPEGANDDFVSAAASPELPALPSMAPELSATSLDRPLSQAELMHASTSPMALGLGDADLECPLPLLRRLAKSVGMAQVSDCATSPLPQEHPFEGDVAIKALWQRLAHDAEYLQGSPETPVEPQRVSHLPMLLRLLVCVTAAGLIALGVTMISLPEPQPRLYRQDKAIVMSAEKFSAGIPAPAVSPARLVIEERQAFANEPLFLGISLNGAVQGEIAQLTGLVTGTRFSVGGAFGGTGWRLPARDLSRAFAFAPQGFVGVMDAAIDLRNGNDALIDRQAVKLEWIPKQGETTARQPLLDREAGKAATAVASLDPQEVAMLVRRGQDYRKTGDLAAARLVLRRAASADNAQAALALGATFDPLVHGELGVLGVPPDLAQARTWYERAVQLGSAEASRRIERLARMRP